MKIRWQITEILAETPCIQGKNGGGAKLFFNKNYDIYGVV
jgi:hypothetical protein